MFSFLTEPYFILVLIIALGIILGQFRIKGISLDNSGVLFIALIMGHFGVVLPGDFQMIGLVLFMFTIGMQAGPGFFGSFKRRGEQMIIAASVLIITATLLTVLLIWLFDVEFGLGVGLLTGALTSTPGLAAAIEGSGSPLASIGYGIAYPFGVIGVILYARLLPQIFHVDLEQARLKYQAAEKAEYPDLQARNFIVENQNITGRSLRQLCIDEMSGATISRILSGDHAYTPIPDSVLHQRDLIRAVGTEEALERIRMLIGKDTDTDIPLSQEYDFQLVLVTNKKVVNKTLGELNLWERYNATVTRIRRSGVEITPQPHRQIRFGDRLMIISARDSMARVIRILGNEEKRLSDTNFLPIALGAVLGVLLGQVEIPLFGLTTIRLGTTGGVLTAGLVLSGFGKTGPVLWSMPGPTNNIVRQIGLLFFLAAVGTDAGSHLWETITVYGPKLILIGGLITLIPMIVLTITARYVLRMNFVLFLGVLSGSMTSTPGLAAIDSMTDSNAPQVGYASVYPVALVAIILAAQIIGGLG